MSNEKITAGKFITRKKTRPAHVVDCAEWLDTSGEDWTFGKFVTRKKTRPAHVMNGFECVELQVPMLQLTVVIDPVNLQSPEELTAATIGVASAIHALDPELQLKYQPERTTTTKDQHGADVVTIVLAPKYQGEDIQQRMQQLLKKVDKTSKEIPDQPKKRAVPTYGQAALNTIHNSQLV